MTQIYNLYNKCWKCNIKVLKTSGIKRCPECHDRLRTKAWKDGRTAQYDSQVARY